MDIREELKYTKTHEWVAIEDGLVKIGITAVAAERLGEIVFVEPPEVDTDLALDEEAGTIESVKAASPLYAPMAGVVTAINEELEDEPEKVNEAPYENYLYILKPTNEDDINTLLNAQEYRTFCEEEDE